MAFAGCAPEEIGTDQFSDDSVTFAAFAPNPVARGGALRITGSNLQKVQEVVIPGVEPITEIEVVKEGKVSEIRVIVPVDGPKVGKVSVVADGMTYSSMVDLTYSEPIIFTSFSTKNVPALPGDVVTIKGDYMNNIRAIQFGGGVSVNKFVSQSRYEMQVVIPSDAISGKIILCDVDENNNPDGLVANLFYSENDLVIGDPVITKADRGELKSGAEVTVAGEYLNMIASVNFGGVDAEFTVAEDGKSLKTNLPATAVDGELVLVSYAGKNFVAGAYTTKVPTGLSIAAETRYKAGLKAVVSGKDLDLVTSATLAGTALTYTYADDKITFDIPAVAVDGAVTLTLANGKTVSTEAVELVKPVIKRVTPKELYAGDKNIKVKGEDLDLVTGVTLGGKTMEFTYADGVIEVVTDATSVSGKIVCSLANGVTVESDDEIKINYHALVVVNSMPTSEHIGAKITLTGANFMLVENIFIGEAKVQTYFSRTDEEVSFVMPWNKVGTYNMYFDLLNGDREMVATPIEVLLEIKYITGWEGNTEITWSDGGRVLVPASKFDGVNAGAKMRLYYTQKDQTWAQAQINYGDWSGLIFPEIGSNTIVPTDIYGWFSDGILDRCTEVTLTQEILDNIQAKKGDAENAKNVGIIIQGSDLTFSKIEILEEIPQEKTIWEGYEDPQNYGVNLELGGDDNSSWRDAGLQVGQTIKIYFDNITEGWSIQWWSGHWGDMLTPQLTAATYPNAITDGFIAVEVTPSMHASLTESQGWGKSVIFQGANLIFTKVTLL